MQGTEISKVSALTSRQLEHCLSAAKFISDSEQGFVAAQLVASPACAQVSLVVETAQKVCNKWLLQWLP